VSGKCTVPGPVSRALQTTVCCPGAWWSAEFALCRCAPKAGTTTRISFGRLPRSFREVDQANAAIASGNRGSEGFSQLSGLVSRSFRSAEMKTTSCRRDSICVILGASSI